MMRPADPEAAAARFAELVLRATARAAREQREHLARLRPTKAERAAARRRSVEASRAAAGLSRRDDEEGRAMTSPWSWEPPSLWRCPRGCCTILTRDAGPRCPRCRYEGS
jgi:rubrerythrin